MGGSIFNAALRCVQMVATGSTPRQLALRARPRQHLDVSVLRRGLQCTGRAHGRPLCGMELPHIIVNVPPGGGALQRERRRIVRASEALTEATVTAMRERFRDNRIALGLA